MTEDKTCPKCGAELPADAPSGICPKCLMQVGLAIETDAESVPELAPTTALSGFVPPEPEDLAKYFPQLEILELLGKGGMGAVYKARQPGLDRMVAVKILPPEVGADPAFAERFTREARALAKLSHQNIVSIFDSGDADGQYFIVMEYVDGANLRHLIETETIKPEEALAIVPQICEALQFAHDAGVVHRDIKPENILVDKQGRVKIADFGLAKLLGNLPAEATLTGTHQAMGTLHYMAPEQMKGAGSVDHRADIFSLGVVFYELLTGQLPIGRFEPPSKRVQVDVRLDEVVLRALENEPARRYQHVSDVKTEVEQINATPQTIKKPQHDENEPTTRYSRKAIVGACCAPLFFICVVLTFWSSSAPLRQRNPEEIRRLQEAGLIEVTDTIPPPEVHANTGTTWWQWSLLGLILFIGLTSPFGTTILGVSAIGDIRRSQGRLTGLPLALADSLVYPLLILDVFVVCCIWFLCVIVYESFGPGTPMSETVFLRCFGITVLLSIATCAYIDFRIARSAWRKVS